MDIWTPIDKDVSTAEKERLECDKCKAVLGTSEGLQRHQEKHRINAEKNQQFDCTACGYAAISDKALINHMKRMHSKRREKKKTESFSSKYKRKRSLRTCSICGKVLIRLHLLQKHLRWVFSVLKFYSSIAIQLN